MSKFDMSYPITDQVLRDIKRFPAINNFLKVRKIDLKEGKLENKEIFRLLNNMHYEKCAYLVDYLEKWIEDAGEIGEKVLVTTNPIDFDRMLAELFVFTHLREILGGDVFPVKAQGNSKSPDIKAIWDQNEVLMEIFTPMDFMGFQLFNNYVTPILKYLDVDKVYRIKIKLESKDRNGISNREDNYFPYSFPDEDEIYSWLNEFQKRACSWLQEEEPAEELIINAPGNNLRLKLILDKTFNNRETREIVYLGKGHSTDSKLFFEVGTAESTAKSQWGKKLKNKLKKMQCGPSNIDTCRILVVNFALADTGWPDFISWERFGKRFKDTIKIIVGRSMPFDVVLPAQLGFESCFGKPVLINDSLEKQALSFIRSAKLDVQCQPHEKETPEEIRRHLGIE